MIVPDFLSEDLQIYIGDALEVLRDFKDESVDCVVTSPPYFGLRDYGSDGQIGLEETLYEYIDSLTDVFREVRRVLTPYGTLWVNIGDSYCAKKQNRKVGQRGFHKNITGAEDAIDGRGIPEGLKVKDLMGVPWRLAFSLQDDGWYLRSDVIWSKPNPMPESIKDRPTKAHEYIFMLTKNKSYWWDKLAVSEPAKYGTDLGVLRSKKAADGQGPTDRKSVDKRLNTGIKSREGNPSARRNVRSVWEITTQSFKGAHFATFPEEIPRRAITASCPIEVCVICGEPRKRLLKTNNPSKESNTGETLGWDNSTNQKTGNAQTSAGLHRNGGGVYSTAEEIGWSKCKCAFPFYRKGIVLDPFAGSGTTMKVARDLGRVGIGIDLQEDYLPLILERNLCQ